MMFSTPDDDLTPEEESRFATLPRVAPVDDLALERTVRALRAEGLLRRPGASGRRVLQVAGALAAGLVVFVSGVAFGQRMTPPATSSGTPAAQVQRAGSDYVKAVVRLSQAGTDSAPAAVIAGLKAGTATLHAAAASLARLDPNDPEVDRLRAVLEFASRGPDTDTTPSSGRVVLWF